MEIWAVMVMPTRGHCGDPHVKLFVDKMKALCYMYDEIKDDVDIMFSDFVSQVKEDYNEYVLGKDDPIVYYLTKTLVPDM